MPLLKGKANIGHNVEEMEKSGHPRKQAVAAALHTALDVERSVLHGVDDGEEVTLNSHMKEQAQKKGAIMSHDAPEMIATTAMTAAEVNEKNKQYWQGEKGNVSSEAKEASPALAQSVPVYNPHAVDAVTPTQSWPPDTRSDNLLVRAPEPPGIIHPMFVLHGVDDGAVGAYAAGKEIGERVAEGEVGDDLAEGAEHMEPGEGVDAEPKGKAAARARSGNSRSDVWVG